MQMQLTYCLPISCDLEAIEGSGTLLNSNFLLKQILWFLGCLFHEKNSRYLKLLPQFELFSLYRNSFELSRVHCRFISAYSFSLEQLKLCSHH